jgi:hypothetical protein
MSENVQREGSRDCKKKALNSRGDKKIISKNCQPHHKTASSFINTHKAAPLYLFRMFWRYYAISESVQRDDQRSSFHDIVNFRYEEHRPALHTEGLIHVYLKLSESYLSYLL